MSPAFKEESIIEDIRDRFYSLRKDKSQNANVQSDLTNWMTILTGIFQIRDDPELKSLIDEIITYAESMNYFMDSYKMALEYAVQRHMQRRTRVV